VRVSVGESEGGRVREGELGREVGREGGRVCKKGLGTGENAPSLTLTLTVTWDTNISIRL
jgi:hypothetical protein